jgi:hypothetical protein
MVGGETNRLGAGTYSSGKAVCRINHPRRFAGGAAAAVPSTESLKWRLLGASRAMVADAATEVAAAIAGGRPGRPRRQAFGRGASRGCGRGATRIYRRIGTSSHLIRWLRAELHESRTEARRLQQLRAAEAVERLGQSFSGNSARRAYVVTV